MYNKPNKEQTIKKEHSPENVRPTLDRRFSVAPMLDWTDRHARYFLRLISRHALLYTEMITTGAIIHGDRDRFLRFDPAEHPVALQLGGSVPADLAFCSRLAEQLAYDEVNLNVGCPSDRVQSGMFGACLMANPALVAECISAMIESVSIPVTVKCRIGIDDLDSYEHLSGFVSSVANAGCNTFIVHARKAWLKGLSPKQNREIPPLQYDTVYRLKSDFPDLQIIINGGIESIAQCQQHLQHVDGVMVGRAAYHNPYLLSEINAALYGDRTPVRSRKEIMHAFLPYIDQQVHEGVYLSHISRHILGLFQGLPGARKFRRYISENAHLPGANGDVIRRALDFVDEAAVPCTIQNDKTHIE
jgi:tRNA-dihydrouridine synthase A